MLSRALSFKFNGGIFNADNMSGITSPILDADSRMWGGGIWMQNTRHSYWPALGSGDYEQKLPYFRWFQKQIPLAEARSRLWFLHNGSFFPETGWMWGTYEGSGGTGYGCTRSPADRVNLVDVSSR